MTNHDRAAPLAGMVLDRPLAFLDIESTGTNPRADRLIELAIVSVHPDGSRQTFKFRVHPQCPIPPEATRIHGIRDEDVAGCPAFDRVAPHVLSALAGCDLAGYNLIRFDIPMLEEEFLRAGIPFDVQDRRIIDAQRIYHKREPRDLSAALKFYCGTDHTGAHGAEADVLATIAVLEGQLRRYPDLPRDLDALSKYCSPRKPDWADSMGRLKWANNEVVLNFGKKKGQSLRWTVENDPGFLKWMLRSDFPRDTIEIVRNALEGSYPDPPEDEGD